MLAAGRGLAALAAGLAEREHDLVGRVGRGDGRGEPGVRAALVGGVAPAGPCPSSCSPSVNVAFGDWALMPVNSDTASSSLALAPPRAEHVVLVVAERADHGDLLARVERERAARVLQQHHRRAPAARARGRGRRRSRSWPRRRPCAWSTKGWSNRPARNLTRRIRRTASLIRLIEIRRCASNWRAEVAELVQTISESVPAFSAAAAASGPSAATPWPHGPSSGSSAGRRGARRPRCSRSR